MSNVFIFSPGGVIVACSINNPGCMHDSQVADQGGVYAKLEAAYNASGGKGAVGSAFARGRYEFLIKSCQTLPSNTPRQRVLVLYSKKSQQRVNSLWLQHWCSQGLPQCVHPFIGLKFNEFRDETMGRDILRNTAPCHTRKVYTNSELTSNMYR